MFGGIALACVAVACARILWINLAAADADQGMAPEPQPVIASSGYARLSSALQTYARRLTAANNYALLFDSRYSLGLPPGTFAAGAPLIAEVEPEATPSASETTQAISSAPSRGERVRQIVSSLAQRLRLPHTRTTSLGDNMHASRAVATAPTEKPSIFQKLFGKPSPLTLAYASTDDGGLDGQMATSGRYDRATAVYDISAHTVYLPNGTKLEAHSGLGRRLDDPHHADERNRGVTPPTVYDLELRKGLFHGVQAIRLLPVDDEKVFGRTGLLAHTYMLGPNGDSNGCVSFRDYNAFLRAYMNHEIKRLAVVTHVD